MTQAAGVGLLGSLLAADGQPFAALRAAPFQHEAAILRTHPYQEAMRAVSVPHVWLKRPFSLHVNSGEPFILNRRSGRVNAAGLC